MHSILKPHSWIILTLSLATFISTGCRTASSPSSDPIVKYVELLSVGVSKLDAANQQMLTQHDQVKNGAEAARLFKTWIETATAGMSAMKEFKTKALADPGMADINVRKRMISELEKKGLRPNMTRIQESWALALHVAQELFQRFRLDPEVAALQGQLEAVGERLLNDQVRF